MKVFFANSRPPEGQVMGGGKKIGRLKSRKGVTLFELLVAMILLVLVSSMLYSVLNVGIKFSSKGEKRIDSIEVERSLLDLLHRQVHAAWYEQKQKKVMITADGETLKIVTGAPLIERNAGLVLAIFRYDPHDKILYYTEKVDFYNPDFAEDYKPALDEMTVLVRDIATISLEYDEDEGRVKVNYLGLEHEMVPRCWQPDEET